MLNPNQYWSVLNPNHYSQGLTLNNPLRPAEHCIQTVQEGLETKWEGSVTILSLQAKLPKKIISKKIFSARHPYTIWEPGTGYQHGRSDVSWKLVSRGTGKQEYLFPIRGSMWYLPVFVYEVTFCMILNYKQVGLCNIRIDGLLDKDEWFFFLLKNSWIII